MTTLYRPVLIESVEQAEALPEGTLAILRDGRRVRQTLTRTDIPLGPWEMNMRGYRHELVLGFTALVPIEAEEVRVVELGLLERDMHGRAILNSQPDVPGRDYRRTEYHTPWEEA